MRFHVENKVSIVLILMAGASLVSMLATLSIDHLINHTLYNYGLQFSTQWAVPYWTMAAVVFAMGWFIIATAIVFELRFLVSVRVRKKPQEPEASPVPPAEVQKQTPTAEAKPSDKSEEEKVVAAEGKAETKALVVETEDSLSEFRVLLDEISAMTNPPVAGEKEKDEDSEGE
jgi:hypothetical protein